MKFIAFTLSLVLALSSAPAWSQEAEPPSDLKIFFDLASSEVRGDQRAALDQAARLFREGNPIVMIISGSADTVGKDRLNLALSVARAQNVAGALVDRGIPADRLQVLGLGNSELAVETDDGVPQQENRNATITWR